jgi:polyhydroxybutyrate depolymerase
LVAAAIASTPAAASASQSPCTVAPPGATVNLFLSVDGVSRGVHVHVPSGLPAGRPVPLLVMLHGQDSNGSQTEQQTGFSALADRAGFIVAYPDALHGRWAITGTTPRAQADVDLVRATITWAELNYCISRSRVWLAGGSLGAGEAARAACALSDRVRAVALIAGDYGHGPPCQPLRPVSILEVHGTDDSAVPYLGGGAFKAESVPVFVAMWRTLDRCRVPGAHGHLDKTTIEATWACTAGTRVRQIKLVGVGHRWPGSTDSARQLPGASSGAIWAWRFFSGR